MPLALLAAFLGSLSIHAAALFLPDIDLSTAPEPPPLTAELKPLPKLPAPEPEVRKPVEPPPKPRVEPARPKPGETKEFVGNESEVAKISCPHSRGPGANTQGPKIKQAHSEEQ